MFVCLNESGTLESLSLILRYAKSLPVCQFAPNCSLMRKWSNWLCFCYQILVLRHAMEAATAEREREITVLQADLVSVRSELEHWRNTAAKYEEEIARLQEAFTQQEQRQTAASELQGEHCLHVCLRLSVHVFESLLIITVHPLCLAATVECTALHQRCTCLQQDCDGLRAERKTLTEKLHRLEAELSRYTHIALNFFIWIHCFILFYFIYFTILQCCQNYTRSHLIICQKKIHTAINHLNIALLNKHHFETYILLTGSQAESLETWNISNFVRWTLKSFDRRDRVDEFWPRTALGSTAKSTDQVQSLDSALKGRLRVRLTEGNMVSSWFRQRKTRRWQLTDSSLRLSARFVLHWEKTLLHVLTTTTSSAGFYLRFSYNFFLLVYNKLYTSFDFLRRDECTLDMDDSYPAYWQLR